MLVVLWSMLVVPALTFILPDISEVRIPSRTQNKLVATSQPSGVSHCYHACPRFQSNDSMFFADYSEQEEIDGVKYQICLYVLDYDGDGIYDITDACLYNLKSGILCEALNCFNFEGRCDHKKADHKCSTTPPKDAFKRSLDREERMHPRIKELQWKPRKDDTLMG